MKPLKNKRTEMYNSIPKVYSIAHTQGLYEALFSFFAEIQKY